MNKRKPDDNAMIDLSYLRPDGTEIVVHCPENQRNIRDVRANAPQSFRNSTNKKIDDLEQTELSQKSNEIKSKTSQILKDETLKDQHYTIAYGDVGHTYDSILGLTY